MLVFYGISDLFLYVKRKIHIRCIVSYLIAGGAVLPWLFLTLSSVKSDLGSYWANVPGLLSPIWTIKYLLDDNTLSFIVFVIASIIGFIILLQTIREKKWNKTLFLWVQTFLSGVWLIGVTFIFSRFINPNGSVYVDRYFFALVPHAILIASFGVKSISELIKNSEFTSSKFKPSIYYIVFFAVIGVTNYSSAVLTVTSIRTPYREAADYLAKTENAYSDDTLIVTSGAGDAWLEYYFLKRGYDIPNNVAIGYPKVTLIAKDRLLLSNPLVVEDLTAFDKVYYSPQKNVPNDNDADLLNFLNKNYTKTWENEIIQLMLYEK